MSDNIYLTDTKDFKDPERLEVVTTDFVYPSIKIYAMPDAKVPTISTQGSGGLDLYIYDFSVQDHQITIFTGVHVELPQGHVGLIVPRSSTGSLGFRLKNTVGVIDSDYRGEIQLVCDRFDNEEDIVLPGKRIAQMVIVPVCPFPMEHVGSLDDLSETVRGNGGFGSTGV